MKKEEAMAIVSNVIAHLEGDWKLIPIESSWQIKVQVKKKILYFCRWDQKDRFEISGGYPHHKAVGYMRYAGNISVGAKRDPKAIAKEITRRLLPDYFRTLKEAYDRIAEYEASLNSTEIILTKFLDQLHELPRRGYNGEIEWEGGFIQPHYHPIKKINLTSNKDKVNMDLQDIPLDLAHAIVTILINQIPLEYISLRQLDDWTVREIIAPAAAKRFGVGVNPHSSRDDEQAVKIYRHWSAWYVEFKGQEYHIMDDETGIEFLTKEERNARLMTMAKEGD